MALGYSSGKTGRPLALLDLGSSKVSCLIVSAMPANGGEASIGAPLPVRKLGYGLTRSRGIRGGAITDLSEAEEAVKEAVAQAETEAGLRVDEVVVSVASERLTSLNFSASTKPANGHVASADIDKILAAGKDFAERDGRGLLQLQRLGFRLDAQTGIRNPRGMTGERLSLDLNAVTTDVASMRNVRLLLDRNYLAVSNLVAAPYASALATLAEEDLQATTVVIDLGAGVSSFALFRAGLFQHAGAMAIGGHDVTQDISRALSIPVNQAERIKVLYGNLVGAMSDEHEYVPLTQGNDLSVDESRLTRAQLRRIVSPRVEATLQLLRERIAASGLGAEAPERLVLTGGASQLAGLGDVAARLFGCRTRVGWPKAFPGLHASAVAPGASVVLGLAYAVLVPGALARIANSKPAGPAGYVGRLGRWFKDSFWDDEHSDARSA